MLLQKLRCQGQSTVVEDLVTEDRAVRVDSEHGHIPGRAVKLSNAIGNSLSNTRRTVSPNEFIAKWHAWELKARCLVDANGKWVGGCRPVKLERVRRRRAAKR